MEYWQRVRQLRQGLGLSAEQLAQRIGYTSSYVYRIEHGQVASPSYRVVRSLSKVLGVPMTELMGDGDKGTE